MQLDSIPCLLSGPEIRRTTFAWKGDTISQVQHGQPAPRDYRQLATPGLIDLHVNGIHTYNFDQGPDALRAAAQIFPRYGTTSFAPTMQPVISHDWLNTLAAVAEAIPAAGPSLHAQPGARASHPAGAARIL